MLVIDAQIHVWAEGMEEYAAKHLHRPLGFDAVLTEMDSAGVARALIVPPNWRSNEVSLELAERAPDRFGVMVVLPLNREEGREMLEGWAERSPCQFGVRLAFPPWRPESWLTDGTADWFWPTAEAAGVPVMLWAPEMWPAIGSVARAYPRLRLIVDHMGLYVDVKDDAIGPAIEPVIALAELANVGVKLSALPANSTDSYPYRNLYSYVERFLDAFGPRRLFWGSDLTRLPCTYRQAVTMFTEEMPFLAAEDLEWIMGRGLAEWLNWS